MPQVFITGATGLLGSYLAKGFLDEGYAVKALKRTHSKMDFLGEYASKIHWIEGDIFDLLILEKAIEENDLVIHSAAVVSFDSADKNLMMKTNVEGTANVVNVCLSKKIKKFVHISSVAALGKKKGQIYVNEESRWEDSDWYTNYAQSKYLSEIEVWRGISEGLPAVIVNPSLILGAGNWQQTSLKIFHYIAKGGKMYPTGLANVVDVRDIVRAVLLLSESPILGQRFILNGHTLSYKELFEKIALLMNKKPPFLKITPLLAEIAWLVSSLLALLTFRRPFISKETARNSQRKVIYENEKLQKAIPTFSFTPLHETLEWVVSQSVQPL